MLCGCWILRTHVCLALRQVIFMVVCVCGKCVVYLCYVVCSACCGVDFVEMQMHCFRWIGTKIYLCASTASTCVSKIIIVVSAHNASNALCVA